MLSNTDKICLTVGYNFDKELINIFDDLNSKYKSNNIYVGQVYGSLPNDRLLKTARPNFRLPKINMDELAGDIVELKKINIDFNYTLNASSTHLWINYTDSEFLTILSLMKDIGVSTITVSNMYLFYKLEQVNRIHKIFKDPFIVISTIMEVSNFAIINDFLTSIYSRWIKKIILSIYSNRNFPLMYALNINNLSKNVELLVNEFCSYKGLPCIYRKSCYEIHSIENMDQSIYPLKICSAFRLINPESFLKAPVIFPWSLKYYSEFNIKSFKISGRTLSTKFIRYVTEAYMSLGEVMDDNLLSLWGHVDRIGTDDLSKLPKVNISCDKLKHSKFMDFFNAVRNRCELITCKQCSHCESFYNICKGEF